MSPGFADIAFLVILALILFGPRRLPQIAREFGRFMAEFRRASHEFQNQIHEEIRKLDLEEPAPSNAPKLEGTVASNGEPSSITDALSRLTDRIKGGPQNYDA